MDSDYEKERLGDMGELEEEEIEDDNIDDIMHHNTPIITDQQDIAHPQTNDGATAENEWLDEKDAED